MTLKAVNDTFYVSQQILVSDIKKFADAGITQIICNRPNNEEAGQPNIEEVTAEAQKYNIKVAYLPIVLSQLNDGNVQEFKNILLNNNTQKTLAYCRSGTRAIILWALANINNLTRTQIIETAKNAGYDIEGMV